MPPASAPSTRVLTEEEKAALLAQQQAAPPPPPPGNYIPGSTYIPPPQAAPAPSLEAQLQAQLDAPMGTPAAAAPAPTPAPVAADPYAMDQPAPAVGPLSDERYANNQRVSDFQQAQGAPPPFQPLQPERIGDSGAITLPSPNFTAGNPLEAFVQGADAKSATDPYAGRDPNPPGPPPSDPLNNPDDAARLQGIRQDNAMPQPGASMMTPTALFEAMIGSGTEDGATSDPFEMDPRLAMRQAVNTPDPYLSQHPEIAALERTLSFADGERGITTDDILNFRPTTGIVPDADGLVRSDAGFMWGPSPWSAGGAVDDAALVASGTRTTPRQSYRPKPRAQSADPIPDILLPRRRSIPVGEAPPSVESPPPTSPPFSGRRTWVAKDPLTGEIINGPGPNPVEGPWPRGQAVPIPEPPPPTRAAPSNPRDFTPLPPERVQTIRQQADAAAQAEAAARIRARQGTPGGDPYANPRADVATATPTRRGVPRKAKAAAAVGVVGAGAAIGKQQMDSHLGGEGESPAATGTSPAKPQGEQPAVLALPDDQVIITINDDLTNTVRGVGSQYDYTIPVMTQEQVDALKSAGVIGTDADQLVGRRVQIPASWRDIIGGAVAADADSGGATTGTTDVAAVPADPYVDTLASDTSGGGSGWVDYNNASSSYSGDGGSGGRRSRGGGYDDGSSYSGDGGGFDFGNLPEGFGGADGFMSGMRSNPMFAHLFGGGDIERPRRGPRVKGKRMKSGRTKSGKSAVPTNEGIREDVNKRLTGKKKGK